MKAAMEVLFWLGTIWLAYVYVGYPLFVGLLGLVRHVRPLVADDFLPTVSVLIAARNEEKDIGWKVIETLQWDYPADRLEVLVASDSSEDRTDDIVQAIKDPRLVFVRLDRRCGKNVALNRLAELAKGELLFFTDANAHIDPHCLQQVVRHFADGRVGCVTGDWRPAQKTTDPAATSGTRAYWRYESLIKYLEGEIGSVLVCVGSIFCMRRSLYRPLQPELANDLELPLRVRHAGYWVLYEGRAQVLEKDALSARQEFARRRRICAQGMLGTWKLREILRGSLGWQFVSRKFLRWLTLLPLLLTLLSTAYLVGRPAFAVLFGLQVLFYSFALIGWLLALTNRISGHPFVSAPFHVLLVNIAALTGVAEACLGRRFAVWEAPSLSRGREEAR